MNDFVNRKKELAILSENISEDTRVTIIYSLHGRGKSTLIEHVLSSVDNAYYINIPNEELLGKTCVEDFTFIKSIAEILSDKLQIGIFRKISNKFSDDSLQISFSLTAFFASIGFDAPKKYKALQSSIIKSVKKAKVKIYIHIENMQKIDTPSLKFLAKLINETNNVFLYLEYIIKDNNSIIMDSSFAYKKFNIKPKYIELESLNWEHVCNIFQNLHLNITHTTKKEYINLNGDIKSLIFTYECEKRKNIELNQDEEFLLNLVMLANAELNINNLYSILQKYNAPYLKCSILRMQNMIDQMIKKEVLSEISERLYVTNLGMQYYFTQYKLLAIEILANYFIPIIENKANKLCSEAIMGLKILVPIFTENKDERIIKLIPFIKKYILPLNYNKKIIDRLYECIKVSQNNTELFFCLLQIYLELGCYSSVLNILEENYINSPKYNILHSISLVNIRPEEYETEEIIKKYIKDEPTKKYISALYTCLIALYMKTRSSKFVIDFVKKLHNRDLIVEQDKNIINKNLSIYYDYSDAVDMIKNSISYFNINKMERFTIASYITLSTRYAQHGKLEIAKKILKILNKSMNLSQLDLVYIDNNWAIIDICLGNIHADIYENLINAYNFLEDEYTKMLAVNNLVVYFTMIKNFSSAQIYVDKIEEVGFSKYNFDEYLHLSYVNLLFYYKSIKRGDKTKYYLNNLEQLKEKCYSSELKKYISKTTNGHFLSKNDKWYFMSNYNFRIAFMGHWLVGNFDI